MWQDLPGALDDAAVTEALELHKIKSRQWAIFKTSATKGEGLFEGLDWYAFALAPFKTIVTFRTKILIVVILLIHLGWVIHSDLEVVNITLKRATEFKCNEQTETSYLWRKFECVETVIIHP